jgi:serine/threonine protein kinase
VPQKVVADRYELLERIGEGGVGSVYRARDRKFAVQVALKVMRASGESYKDLRERAWQEAQISHVLGQERGLVRAIDWGEVEDEGGQAIYLALDLVEGARPLDLSMGSLDLRLATLAEATELVAICHRYNVVHRDIKPANFLISDDGRLFLSDFGISKKLGALSESSEDLSRHLRTETGSALGTPVFMALEQLEDASNVDGRADVFSLGVMLFLLLTGQYPYGMGGLPIVYGRQTAVKRGERPAPRPSRLVPDIPPALDQLCADAVSVDRERRPDIDGFLRALVKPQRPATRKHARSDRIALRREVDRVLGGDEPTIQIQRRSKGSKPDTDANFPDTPWTAMELIRLRAQLGIERDGFTTIRRLRSLLEDWGAKKLALVARQSAVLLVHTERPLNGVTRMVGRAAFLLPAPERAEVHEVILGRNRSSDLQIPFPSISKRQVRFVRSAEGWTLADLGSRNGTQLSGEALVEEELHLLSSGDLINLSEHVTLRYVRIRDLGPYLA